MKMIRNLSSELPIELSHVPSKSNRVPYMGCQSLLYQNKITKETVLRHTKSMNLSMEDISCIPTSILIHQSSPQSIPSFSTYHSNENLSNDFQRNNNYISNLYDTPPIERITSEIVNKRNSTNSNNSVRCREEYSNQKYPSTVTSSTKKFWPSCVGGKSPSMPRNMKIGERVVEEKKCIRVESLPARRPISFDMGNKWSQFHYPFFTSGSENINWTRHSIKQSILNYVPKNQGKNAIRTFKVIQKYMGDRRTRKSPSQLIALLQHYLSHNDDLKDEVLIQICKQTINNPDDRSICRGWELLSECLLQFSPSQRLLTCFSDFISFSIIQESRKDPSSLNTSLANLKKCEYHLSWFQKKSDSEILDSLDSSSITISNHKRKRSFSENNHNGIDELVIYSPQSLSDLMKQQSFSFPQENIPLELIILCDQIAEDIDKADSFCSLYRSINDPKIVKKVSMNLEKWFNISCRKDPHLVEKKNIPNLKIIALHVLINWFSSLSQPVISPKMVLDNTFSFNNLEKINKRVLLYMANFLQINVIKKSKDSLINIASFLCPLIFQLPNDKFYPLTNPSESEFMNIILKIFHNYQK